MSDLYAMMGNPVAHSQAPFIHKFFAEQTGQDINYERILVPVAGLIEAVKEFQARSGKGLNLTIPFKEQAWEICQERSVRATMAKAVNTIVFKEGDILYGDITDGIGLSRDLLHNLHWPLEGKRLLLLGAGGTIRGVIASLLAEHPADITIVNRTRNKAEQLGDDFSNMGDIHVCDYEDLPEQAHGFDLIINGTSASLQGEAPPLPEGMDLSTCHCYDMFYDNKKLTPFLKWAKKHDVKKYADGIGMLIEQAAESFYLWRGVRPDTKPVLQQWRDA